MMSMYENHPQESIPAYVLGALDPAEAVLVDQHLNVCFNCRQMVDDYRNVVSLLPFAAAPQTPAPALKRRIMDRIAADQAQPAAQVLPRRQPRSWMAVFSVSSSLVFLLALLVLGGALFRVQGRVRELADTNQQLASALQATRDDLGVLQGNLQQTREELASRSAELAQVQAQLATEQYVVTFISAPGVATRELLTTTQVNASGKMYMRPGEENAVVVISGLQPLQAGQTYQFWLARGDQQVSGGIFTVSTDGLVRLQVDAPEAVNVFTEVMVTVEPEGGSTQPSNQVVLSGSL